VADRGYLCGLCASPRGAAEGPCEHCGAKIVLPIEKEHVVAFPPDSMPCNLCGTTAEELRFGGWTRIVGIIWSTRETRLGAYVCQACAERQTTRTLLWNALLGWWSIPTFFFYGWRALYWNFMVPWGKPHRPGDWERYPWPNTSPGRTLGGGRPAGAGFPRGGH
jgi:hypothetical protein